MGGSGSGNRWRWGSRDTCESYTRIELPYLKRRGFLRPGCSGSLSWSRGGEPSGNISFRMHEYGMELIYKYRSHGEGEWRDVNELVPFAYTNQHFGGRRRWFQCKTCRRLCAVLYGGTHYRCRKCWNLAYQTQHEDVWSRAITKAQRLRRRLGGSQCTDDPFPDKPKGMHWRTYERLRARGEALDERADVMGWQRVASLLGMRF
jgi:hypothetical protein